MANQPSATKAAHVGTHVRDSKLASKLAAKARIYLIHNWFQLTFNDTDSLYYYILS